MKQIPRSLFVKKVRLVERTTLSLGVGFLCMGVFVGTSVAGPPQAPLAPPFYSFDRESPTFDPAHVPPTELRAYDILKLVPLPWVPPAPRESTIGMALPGSVLGLVDSADELNALSSGNPGLSDTEEFILFFSIHRASTGSADPDEVLRRNNVPYNAKEQAVKGHAAGDQFMALDEFTRAGGPISGDGGSRAPATNLQTRNQHNEGGSDFGGEPESGSVRPSQSGGDLEQDNVASMMLTGRSDDEYQNGLTEAYFSVKAGSPSLGDLGGGGGDAASIFYYNANPIPPGPTTTVFAYSDELGLTSDDDIDAMIVFDTNNNGVFDGNDQVLFSLTPESPSLGWIDGAGPTPAADVFTHSADDDPDLPPASPRAFATADNLGLGESEDNVDALDYFVCEIGGNPNPNALACAARYGIRGQGVPAVSDWGLVVFTLLVLGAGALVIRRRSRRVAFTPTL